VIRGRAPDQRRSLDASRRCFNTQPRAAGAERLRHTDARPPMVPAPAHHTVLDLQRLAGNAAVAATLISRYPSRLGGSTWPFVLQRAIEKRTTRPLTSSERAEARRVFAGALDLDVVRLSDYSTILGSRGPQGQAWVFRNHVHFPPGSFSGDYLPLLIHELTHAWQYQHGASLPGLIFDAIQAVYEYGGEAGLRRSWEREGHAFADFTYEQQGDILEDYYKRLRARKDTKAWQPYVDQVRSGRWRERPPLGVVEPLFAGTLDWYASAERNREGREREMVRQLRAPVRRGDASAIQARRNQLLEQFRSLVPYWAEYYRERLKTRRSNDELVALLHRRVSSRTRATIVEILTSPWPKQRARRGSRARTGSP
jgi:hypothetical protein